MYISRNKANPRHRSPASRRDVLAFLAGIPALVSLSISEVAGHQDDEFVIVDGWVLRRDELIRAAS